MDAAVEQRRPDAFVEILLDEIWDWRRGQVLFLDVRCRTELDGQLQSMVPGYRDRLVHIYLDKLEGGLNLNMPAALVTKLSGYGTEAAEALIDHFVNGRAHGEVTPMTWDNHRWIRYRSTVALLEAFVENFAFSLENPEPGDRSFFQLIKRAKLDPPESYKLSDDQRNYATVRTLEIEELGQSKGPVEAGAPKPTPALRIRPTL